jgi:hypothetical protein
LNDIRLTIEAPPDWVHGLEYDVIGTLNPKSSLDIMFGFRTDKAPRFLGFDTDGDGFADVFKNTDNELGVNCENEDYSKVNGDGLTPGEYNVRIKAKTGNVSQTVLDYTIIIHEEVDT